TCPHMTNGSSIAQVHDQSVQVTLGDTKDAKMEKYETLLESVDRLLNSDKTRVASSDPEWNNEVRILKRLSSIVYDSNHNAIELDYKRKEVSLLKQTVENLQAQLEHEQSINKELEAKLKNIAIREQQNG